MADGMAIKKIFKSVHQLKPALSMVVVQLSFTVVNVFYKLAAFDGMNLRILIAYRMVFGSVFLIPLALFFERNGKPKLTWTILFQAFFCGLFGGSLAQNLYLESLKLTSGTFVSAIANLTPAFTFILAICFGLEEMGITTVAGKAKVVGTVIGIGGAMLLTFYKGAEIHIWSTHVNLLNLIKPHGGQVAASDGNKIVGSLYALASFFSFSVWLIIQAKMSAKYPCPYSSTALMCTMAAVQTVSFTLCVERDWSQWKLGWNIRLFASAYTGIVMQGMMTTLIIWCVRMKGPLFTSIFNPLMLVFTALVGSLLLDEKLNDGSIIGAILIVCGLYAVLWGNDRELKRTNNEEESAKEEEREPQVLILGPTL